MSEEGINTYKDQVHNVRTEWKTEYRYREINASRDRLKDWVAIPGIYPEAVFLWALIEDLQDRLAEYE